MACERRLTFLLLLLHLLFESLKRAEITECGFLDCGSCSSLSCLGSLACCGFLAAFRLVGIFCDAAVAEDDAFAVFVELDYLEVKFLVEFSLCAILFYEMLGGVR